MPCEPTWIPKWPIVRPHRHPRALADGASPTACRRSTAAQQPFLSRLKSRARPAPRFHRTSPVPLMERRSSCQSSVKFPEPRQRRGIRLKTSSRLRRLWKWPPAPCARKLKASCRALRADGEKAAQRTADSFSRHRPRRSSRQSAPVFNIMKTKNWRPPICAAAT
jgi:hypothetical protein